MPELTEGIAVQASFDNPGKKQDTLNHKFDLAVPCNANMHPIISSCGVVGYQSLLFSGIIHLTYHFC